MTVIKAKGFKWNVNDENDKSGAFMDESETIIFRTLQNCASKRKVFIDVGAFVGTFSVRLASLFKETVAVEPDPDNFSVLKKNIASNKLGSSIKAFNIGCGDTQERRYLYCNKAFSSFVAKAGVEVIEADVDLLDNLVNAASVIKIDVSGYEVDVIKGAKKLLEHRPIVAIKYYKSIKRAEGAVDYIKLALNDYLHIPAGAYLLHIPKETKLEPFTSILSYHWLKFVVGNIREGKDWYHGLPCTWWWGMSIEGFILELPKYVAIEEEWLDPFKE